MVRAANPAAAVHESSIEAIARTLNDQKSALIARSSITFPHTPQDPLPSHVPPEAPTTLPPTADPLGEMLHTLRLRGTVYARSHLTAPWGVEMPPMPGCLMFHVVTQGECHLTFPDREPAVLRPGEFALLPRGEGHAIRHKPDAPTQPFFDLPIQRVCERYEVLTHGGGGEETTLVCGAVRFEHPAAADLIALLPPLIHVRTWASHADAGRADPHTEWMHSTLRLMAAEAKAQQPGGETILTRLADILVIQAIRSWLATPAETEAETAQQGWLGALRDPRIGPALLAVHRDPAHAWTVESLARSVAMSRSAFAARFTELVGEPAMQHVTRRRMHQAAAWLLDEDHTASQCAARLGYQSEAAFSRAFKRVMGHPPGAWQTEARAARSA